MSFYLANQAKDRASRAAHEKALEAAATAGEPAITPTELEKARHKYMHHLTVAALLRDGEGQPALSLDGCAAEVRRHLEQSELDRLDYEHKRSLWEAQERSKYAQSADALARSNTELARRQTRYAWIVAVAMAVQTLIAVAALFHRWSVRGASRS